ncbi:MAG: hypothetical protein K2X38_17465 [Gemmataceae bacterium]|nr:hypothetical protein [Gemmataceae bacterium]
MKRIQELHVVFSIRSLVAFVALLAAAPAQAGLYISTETFADLPSQWRGFLLDHRTLRNIAVPPTNKADASPFRLKYEKDAKTLVEKRERTAEEKADLGGLLIRLGKTDDALVVLRRAQGEHPNDFRIAANLGSAWQMQGDYAQATVALEQAVRLAPGKLLAVEQAHLRLVRGRIKQVKGEATFDDLFGVRWVDDAGHYAAGKIAEAEWKRLPAKSVAIVQQLALWIPADGPLLWQLGELANASGDVSTAAAMLDGCVVQFGMGDRELRRHRAILREAADQLPKSPEFKEPHEKTHVGKLAFRSRRPLLTRLDSAPLPEILADGVNPIPWELFAETTVEKPFRLRTANYIKELDGKSASLVGYMQPLGPIPETNVFLLIESPVGCWYCEMPDTSMIVRVELPDGRTTPYRRGAFRVIGKLTLNRDDPEDFFYTLREARIVGLD